MQLQWGKVEEGKGERNAEGIPEEQREPQKGASSELVRKIPFFFFFRWTFQCTHKPESRLPGKEGSLAECKVEEERIKNDAANHKCCVIHPKCQKMMIIQRHHESYLKHGSNGF